MSYNKTPNNMSEKPCNVLKDNNYLSVKVTLNMSVLEEIKKVNRLIVIFKILKWICCLTGNQCSF